jgi:hypothetical protein
VIKTTDPPGPTFKYPTEADFCSAKAAAECNDSVVGACYGSDAASLPKDRASCVSAAGKLATCNPDNLQYHPQLAEGCIAALSGAWSDAKLSRDEASSIADACVVVFNDGGTSGSGCTLDSDCDATNGLRCITKSAGAEGTKGSCGIATKVAAGDDCSANNAVCNDGYYCDGGQHCVSAAKEGQTCSDIIPCGSDFKCTGATMKSCIQRANNGSPCVVDDDCKGYCSVAQGANQGTCTATIQLAATSQACNAFR